MNRFVILLGTLALVAAACSNSNDTAVASLAGSTTTTVGQDASGEGPSDVSDEEAILAFAACMRDNGVEGFEDPTFDSDGRPQFSFRGQEGGGPFGGVDRETVEAAFDACQDELGGIAFGPGARDLTELQDTFVEFAACMRENGYDMPDPDFSNFGNRREGGEGGGLFGGAVDPTDPDFQSALEACQSLFDTLPFGGGRARSGG